MEYPLYDKGGENMGKVDLPEEVFGLKLNADLLHQVVTSQMSNRRQVIAHAKGRGEVRGGGKKPWKQKGTGRARHGSSRSPIWVGGGVTHGPLAEKNYKRKISKSMRAQALFSVLSKKMKDGEILFVDSLSMPSISTKTALGVIDSLSKATGLKMPLSRNKPRILTALFERNEKSEKSFRNIPVLSMIFLKNLNPLEVLNHKYLLIENPEESVKFLESRS